MPTPNIYFVIFREDVAALGQLAVPALGIMAIPALPVALLTWIIGVRVQWRTVIASIVVAWLSGALGTWITLPVLAGMAIVGRDLINDEPLKYHDIDARVVTILSLIGGCICACVTTLRFNRWVFDRQRNGRVPEPTTRRRFSFSLRAVLIAQLLLLAVMGLWLAARRPNVERYYWYTNFESQRIKKTESASRRFSRHGWQIHLSGLEQKLCLYTWGNPLNGFTDEVLQSIETDDQLMELELRSNQLTDKGLATLSAQTSLQSLKLASGEITDDGIAHLKALMELNLLVIQGSKITPQSLESLQGMGKLRRLQIELPRDSEASIAAFRKARPDVDLQVTPRF